MNGTRSLPYSAGAIMLLSVLTACMHLAQPTIAPITSTGDPAAPVPFHWTLPPDGLLRLQGGNPHALASELRLLDATGRAVADGPATPLGAGAAGLCGVDQPHGMVGGSLQLPDASKWPGQYRLEAKVGGVWRPTQLTKAC